MVENKTDVGHKVCTPMPDIEQVVVVVIVVMLITKMAEQVNWLETA